MSVRVTNGVYFWWLSVKVDSRVCLWWWSLVVAGDSQWWSLVLMVRDGQ